MKTATLAEFAKIRDVHKSTVTRYKQSGRLVFTDDGLVDVEASNQRIADTADPNRDDVVRRHANNKGMEMPDEQVQSGDYQKARAKKEKYHALHAKADYEEKIGQLVKREDIDRDWAEVATTLRSHIERIADVLPAELAVEQDPKRIRTILKKHINDALTEAADKIKKQSERI